MGTDKRHLVLYVIFCVIVVSLADPMRTGCNRTVDAGDVLTNPVLSALNKGKPYNCWFQVRPLLSLSLFLSLETDFNVFHRKSTFLGLVVSVVVVVVVVFEVFGGGPAEIEGAMCQC